MNRVSRKNKRFFSQLNRLFRNIFINIYFVSTTNLSDVYTCSWAHFNFGRKNKKPFEPNSLKQEAINHFSGILNYNIKQFRFLCVFSLPLSQSFVMMVLPCTINTPLIRPSNILYIKYVFVMAVFSPILLWIFIEI